MEPSYGSKQVYNTGSDCYLLHTAMERVNSVANSLFGPFEF